MGSEKPKIDYSINSLKADNTDSIVKLADDPPNWFYANIYLVYYRTIVIFIIELIQYIRLFIYF